MPTHSETNLKRTRLPLHDCLHLQSGVVHACEMNDESSEVTDHLTLPTGAAVLWLIQALFFECIDRAADIERERVDYASKVGFESADCRMITLIQSVLPVDVAHVSS